MPTRSDEVRTSGARTRAEASFKKEERAREGAQAMLEYLANNRAVRERTARLRELRLAKEAAEKDHPPAKKPVVSKPIASKPVARKASAGKH